MENLLLLATVLGGVIPKSNGQYFNSSLATSDLLPSIFELNENVYRDLAGGSQTGISLSGLQPDILGEQFVLDCLDEDGLLGLNFRRLFHDACSIQPDSVVAFCVRTFLDFSNDKRVEKLFDAPSDSQEFQIFKAKLLAPLFTVPGAIIDGFLNTQMDALVDFADSHPEEVELQELTAVIEYNLACTVLFSPMPLKKIALDLFDSAISRAGQSRIGIMATLNRGILFDDEKKAMEAWSNVIEAEASNDEMRACALNNRANILFDREDHKGSIRDRSGVVGLKDTSADRRFVALFGRAESYVAQKKYPDAVNDITAILESNDIGDNDKLHARLQRGVYLYYSKRIDDSRNDFNAVIVGLLQDSHEIQLWITPEEVKSAISLIKRALLGIESGNSKVAKSVLKQLSEWNTSKSKKMRISYKHARDE